MSTATRPTFSYPSGSVTLRCTVGVYVHARPVDIPAGTVGITAGTEYDHFARMTGRVCVEFTDVEGHRWFSSRIDIDQLVAK